MLFSCSTGQKPFPLPIQEAGANARSIQIYLAKDSPWKDVKGEIRLLENIPVNHESWRKDSVDALYRFRLNSENPEFRMGIPDQIKFGQIVLKTSHYSFPFDFISSLAVIRIGYDKNGDGYAAFRGTKCKQKKITGANGILIACPSLSSYRSQEWKSILFISRDSAQLDKLQFAVSSLVQRQPYPKYGESPKVYSPQKGDYESGAFHWKIGLYSSDNSAQTFDSESIMESVYKR